MTKDSFLKCGLSNNLDDTKVDQIKIKGIEDYTIPSAELEFTLLGDNEESGGCENEFTEVDIGYANNLT